MANNDVRRPPFCTAAMLVLLVSGRVEAQCSGSCYPASYDIGTYGGQFHWPTNKQVQVFFDGDGYLGRGAGDAAPKFTLNSLQETDWAPAQR